MPWLKQTIRQEPRCVEARVEELMTVRSNLYRAKSIVLLSRPAAAVWHLGPRLANLTSMLFARYFVPFLLGVCCSTTFAQPMVYSSFQLEVSKTLFNKKTNELLAADNKKIDKLSGLLIKFHDEVMNKTFEISFFDPTVTNGSVPRVVLGVSIKSDTDNKVESRTKRIIYSEGSYYLDEAELAYAVTDLGNGNSLMKVLPGSSGDSISTIDVSVSSRKFPDGSQMISYSNDNLKISYDDDIEVAALRSSYIYRLISMTQFFRELPARFQDRVVKFSLLNARVLILEKQAGQCLRQVDCAGMQLELRTADEERDKFFANMISTSDFNLPRRRAKPKPPAEPSKSSKFCIPPLCGLF
ncbi:MAG: hypothetical protein ACXVA9_13475 [Bdellovibrionales bacterium]